MNGKFTRSGKAGIGNESGLFRRAALGKGQRPSGSCAALAQLVEHRIRNAEVACSSHASGTIRTLCLSAVAVSTDFLKHSAPEPSGIRIYGLPLDIGAQTRTARASIADIVGIDIDNHS